MHFKLQIESPYLIALGLFTEFSLLISHLPLGKIEQNRRVQDVTMV